MVGQRHHVIPPPPPARACPPPPPQNKPSAVDDGARLPRDETDHSSDQSRSPPRTHRQRRLFRSTNSSSSLVSRNQARSRLRDRSPERRGKAGVFREGIDACGACSHSSSSGRCKGFPGHRKKKFRHLSLILFEKEEGGGEGGLSDKITDRPSTVFFFVGFCRSTLL